MKKIYTLANMAKGMMLAALLAVGTTALAQNVSGNTENGTVEGTENGSNENETFAPAAESSWLQPVKLVGNGQKAYIYNVATKTFITGKTATVKNIKDADVWTINGDKTRCFTCDNETKDHLFLGYSSLGHPFTWYAEVSYKRDATDFTIVEGSTKNSYKLTKNRNKLFGGIETSYFSVSGEKYVASLEPSIDNDWLFHFYRPEGCLCKIYFPLHRGCKPAQEREAERSGICSERYQNCIAGDCQGYFRYLQL